MKKGDVVLFRRLDGVLVRDTVREPFTQADSLGNSFPAVVLTEHSWCAVSDIVKINPSEKE